MCRQLYSGAGTRGNGVPTPFSCFALKSVEAVLKWLDFWVCSHTLFVSTTSLRVDLLHLKQLCSKCKLFKNSCVTAIRASPLYLKIKVDMK